jgi:hypothetical protein
MSDNLIDIFLRFQKVLSALLFFPSLLCTGVTVQVFTSIAEPGVENLANCATCQ